MNLFDDHDARLRVRLNKIKARLRRLQAEADLAQAETRLRYGPSLAELHIHQVRLEEQLHSSSR